MRFVEGDVSWVYATVWQGWLYVLRSHPPEIEAVRLVLHWEDVDLLRVTLVERWPVERDGTPGVVSAAESLTLERARVSGLKAATGLIDGLSGAAVDRRALRNVYLWDDFGEFFARHRTSCHVIQTVGA